MRYALCISFFLAANTIVNYGSSLAESPTTAHVAETMKRSSAYFSSIATNGGYCGIYSLDLKERYGEALYEKAKETDIWVQPPGTPSVGEAYLRGWRATGDRVFLDYAIAAAKALAWGQRREGGWDHLVDVSHMKAGQKLPERINGRCTFDDDITQGALEFLMDLDRDIDESWLTDSIELGFTFMMESQFDNGAWPQWYPLIGGYHDYYTFNDNTINDCIMLMLKIHEQYEKSDYLACAERGGDFIILSQLPAPQSGWAQQYSHDMKPAWARAFEPPAVCSAVTIRNIRTLVDLYHYTGNEKYLKPIPAALAWLEASKIGDNLWARMYEVGTNRPIYGDRDSKIHYTLEEISEERRKGYSWQSNYGFQQAERMYRSALSSGQQKVSLTGKKLLTAQEKEKRLTAITPDVERIVHDLDDNGRWVRQQDSMIHSQDFVNNFNTLCEYVELAGGE